MKIALFYIMIGFSFICVNTQKNLKTVKGEGHKLTKKKRTRKLAKNETNTIDNEKENELKKSTQKKITSTLKELLFETTSTENNTDYILMGFDQYKINRRDVDHSTSFITNIFHDNSVKKPEKLNLYADLKFNNASQDGYYKIECWETHNAGSVTSSQCSIPSDDIKSIRIMDTMEINNKNMTIPHTSYADYQLEEGINKFPNSNLQKLRENGEVVLNNTKIIDSSSHSFTLRGNLTNEKLLNSKNIKLFLMNNGNGVNATCNSEANYQDDTNCDMSCTTEGIVDTNLSNTLGFMPNDEVLLVNFKKGENSVVNHAGDSGAYNKYKKKKKGMPTGAIIAILIPCLLIVLGVTALAFLYKRNPTPPQAVALGNNTLGAANSSTNIVANQ